MYTVQVSVEGVAPLLQHRYPLPDFENVNPGGTQSTGSKDYTQEWRQYLYQSEGMVCQPAIHFERSMIKAAANFKVAGKRGKSYKDLFSAAVFITPDMIPFGIPVPAELDTDADKPIYIDYRPVVVSRARVIRLRPALKPGWKLDFEIEVIDDQLPFNILQDVCSLAGKVVGIGDFRPRFGRFRLVEFRKT